MKILLLVAMLFVQTDTGKKTDIILYHKIDQKVKQIKVQAVQQSHSTEDLYLLQMKSFKTLTESHALTKQVLMKNDSLERIGKQNILLIKALGVQVDDLSIQVQQGNAYKEQVNQFNSLIKNWTMIFGGGCLILLLLGIFIAEYKKHVLNHHI